MTMLAVVAGCAHQIAASVEPEAPGFWRGLFHGIAVIPAFIASLFSSDYAVYSVPNNGNWYNFGFVLGIGAFSGGTHSTR